MEIRPLPDQRNPSMTNIPTDLLRTLVAVVDMRSFTKAAQSLGVTQPAVSAQIKRLQYLLGTDVLDKSAPGVSLTSTGELVVTYARRLLSINDQILHLAAPGVSGQTMRIGLAEDFITNAVAWTLARFRTAWPQIRYRVRSAGSDALLRDLRGGELDLVIGFSTTAPGDARHVWREELAWLRGPSLRIDPAEPVPLVSQGDECAYHRAAVGVLNHAGRDAELVFTGSGLASVAAAVSVGLGVTVRAPRRLTTPQLIVWNDAPLPLLPQAYGGVYLHDHGDRGVIEQLADALAAALRPVSETADKTAARSGQ